MLVLPFYKKPMGTFSDRIQEHISQYKQGKIGFEQMEKLIMQEAREAQEVCEAMEEDLKRIHTGNIGHKVGNIRAGLRWMIGEK